MNQISTCHRGKFTQKSVGSFILKSFSQSGFPKDPSPISCTIKDSSNSDIEELKVDKVKDGVFVSEYSIPATQDVGNYVAFWEYTLDGVDYEEEHNFVISKYNDNGASLYTGMILLMRDSLELLIGDYQNVPIYDEQAKPTFDKKKFFFTKQLWNPSPNTRIYRNGKIISKGFDIDFQSGCVTFDSPLDDVDIVNADYTFKFYSDEQLDRFISNGIHILNSFPPITRYNIGSLTGINERHIVPILYAAAVDALRNLMLKIQTQENAYIIGSERADQVFSNLETLKKNYEEMLNSLLEQKKYMPYKGLTKMLIKSNLTLPGGRSRWFRMMFK